MYFRKTHLYIIFTGLLAVLAAFCAMAWLNEPPLHKAVRMRDLSEISRLLATRSDADLRWAPRLDKNEPVSAIEYAAKIRCADCISLLASDKSAFSLYRGVRLIDLALGIASEGDRRDCVLELLRNGADANSVLYANGMVPLGIAAMAGDADSVEVMVRYGGDINQQIANGATPLMLAVSSQSRASPHDIARLLALGARADIKDCSGSTAKDWVQNGYRTDRDIICDILQNVGCK